MRKLFRASNTVIVFTASLLPVERLGLALVQNGDDGHGLDLDVVEDTKVSDAQAVRRILFAYLSEWLSRAFRPVDA